MLELRDVRVDVTSYGTRSRIFLILVSLTGDRKSFSDGLYFEFLKVVNIWVHHEIQAGVSEFSEHFPSEALS